MDLFPPVSGLQKGVHCVESDKRKTLIKEPRVTIQSNSKFEGTAKMGVYADNMRVREAIGNVLVPEDIEIEEVLFCLFDAE